MGEARYSRQLNLPCCFRHPRFLTSGGHFEEPIVEDRPLSTSSFGMPLGMLFGHGGGHFDRANCRGQALSTSSF